MRTTTHTKKQAVVHACLAVLLAASAWHVAGAEDRDDDDSPNELRVIGLTEDGRLVSFRARSPERTRNLEHVTGFTGTDRALIGVDFRVQDGKLYGVGNGGGVYTIDPRTAEATLVNTLTMQLEGRVFGVDFNPAADRLRIISDAGQNLAHNVNAGGVTVANATLTYTAPPGHACACVGCHSRCLHEQRSESAEHGHDAVRPGHDAGPGRYPISPGQRHPRRDREARG
jgi:Domain of unknown function (DUF4394)